MAAGQMSKVIDELRWAALHDDVDRTDGELLEDFLARGEQGAFEVLVQRHGRMVLGVCRRILSDGHDAEDAFQASFLVLVRKAASLRHRRTVGDWLHGVAHNTALKARAAALRRRAKERESAAMGRDRPLEDLWQELQPLLDLELSRLPEKYRVPIVLCDLEGKTRKDAAQHLGWPEGTVSGRLARGRVLLAERLRRQGLRLSGGALALALSQQAAAASVPVSLALTTAKSATLMAAGQAIATGAIAAQVALLTEGVLKAMLITKLKLAAGLVLVAGLIGTGVGTLAVGQDARREAAQGEGRGRREEPSVFPPGLDRLELNDAQKEKLAKIKKELDEKLAVAKQRLTEASQQARQNQNRQQAQEANEAFRKATTQLQEEVQGALKQILSEEQLRGLAQQQRREQPGRVGGDLLRMLGQLELNDEQKQRVEKLVKEVSERQEALQRRTQEALEQARANQDRNRAREAQEGLQKESAKLQEELQAQIGQTLTEEQRRRLGELAQQRRAAAPEPPRGIVQVLPPGMPERLGLNAEQREKVEALQKELEGKLREILTEEQNRRVEELRRGDSARARPRE